MLVLDGKFILSPQHVSNERRKECWKEHLKVDIKLIIAWKPIAVRGILLWITWIYRYLPGVSALLIHFQRFLYTQGFAIPSKSRPWSRKAASTHKLVANISLCSWETIAWHIKKDNDGRWHHCRGLRYGYTIFFSSTTKEWSCLIKTRVAMIHVCLPAMVVLFFTLTLTFPPRHVCFQCINLIALTKLIGNGRGLSTVE